jgi:transposase
LLYGWIKKGERKEIKSNTGRKRININGALNAETREAIVVEANSINAESTICLLRKIEDCYPLAPYIYVFTDNARYYHSEAVANYLKTSKIILEPIPSYSPNLNLIERLWNFFHKKIHYNKYYETFAEFRIVPYVF